MLRKSMFYSYLDVSPGTNMRFGVPGTGKNLELLLDRPNRLGPKSNEFDTDPDTSKAIANFATSLDFHVRPRQAKSNV
jgi:hypothetical protein